MTFGNGHVLIRIVGSQVHITELSQTEIAPKRRVIQLERFLEELRPEPMRGREND